MRKPSYPEIIFKQLLRALPPRNQVQLFWRVRWMRTRVWYRNALAHAFQGKGVVVYSRPRTWIGLGMLGAMLVVVIGALVGKVDGALVPLTCAVIWLTGPHIAFELELRGY
jgi:hypothetical protein